MTSTTTTKKIILYGLLVAILFSIAAQPIKFYAGKNVNPGFEDNDNTPLSFEEGLQPPQDGTFTINSLPYNYSKTGGWKSSGGSVHNIVVDGNFAFVADGPNGLKILNITDKSNPTLYGAYQNGSAILYEIYKKDNYLLLAYGTNGLIILDTSLSLITPQYVASVTSEFNGHECLALDVQDNWTYVAAGEFGFAVIKTADMTHPQYTGRYYRIGVDIRDIDVYINFAYIADANYGLRRVDIASNKVNPTESGNGYPSGSALSVYIRHDYYALIADYTAFYVVSMYSYPTFTKVGEYADGNHPLGVFGAWETAFVTYSDGVGMRMFNITEKDEGVYAKFVARYNSTGEGFGVYVQDDFAYVCDGTAGLDIVGLDQDSDDLYDNYELEDTFTMVDNPDTDNDTLTDGAEFYGLYAPSNPYTDHKGYFHGLDPLDNDTDNDLITDDEEVYLGVDGYYTNPLNNDSDGDGISDYDELNVYLTNPTTGDSDGDGLSDGDEINIYGTNPNLKDTDSDGMPDGYEILHNLNATYDDSHEDLDNDGIINIDEWNVTFTKPEVNDTDTDGLLDGEEFYGVYAPTHPYANGTGYITGLDPLVADTDRDGLDDGEEVNLYSTNPLDQDSDGDLLNDYEEVITYNTDPNDPDTDNDSLGDYWEATEGTDPLVNDTYVDYDNDGLTNLQEMNLGTKPKVADTDGDSMDDGWEVSNGLDPLDASDAELDNDSDGLTNADEFAANTNPNLADTDSDGMDDKWEVDNGTDPLVDDADADPDEDTLTNIEEMTIGTDPLDPDTDRDTLLDGVEVHTYGTNPLDPDTDHDGVRDDVEILKGTDPLDPNSNPQQRNRLIYTSIGSSVAGGILVLVAVFFAVYWLRQPEQKMFRYLAHLRSKGVKKVTLKEVAVYLDKRLTRGDIKKLINQFGEAKGYKLEDNKILLEEPQKK